MIRSTIENGDGSDPVKWAAERPVFEHYACGMYLSGCLSYLESTYGKAPWKSSTTRTFDQFISSRPAKQLSNYSRLGISENGIEALVCIRNAFVHNNSDLALNKDKSSLTKVARAALPGIHINGSTFELSSNNKEDFMAYVRLALVAVAQFHGDG
jgi:hypothetical protein